MIFGPKIGEKVLVHYRKSVAPFMPYHGRIGVIIRVANGRPKNIGVQIGDERIVFPCGNLNRLV
jgi:ribosomal protein L21E